MKAHPSAVVLLLGFALANAAHAEALGRLFFTPERRVALERQRQLNIQEAQSLESSTMSLNGVVVRSSGRKTVWVNSRAQHDSAAPGGVAADVSRREPGKAVLSAGEEAPASLKVGETFNRATREKADALGGGQARVNRPAPTAKP